MVVNSQGESKINYNGYGVKSSPFPYEGKWGIRAVVTDTGSKFCKILSGTVSNVKGAENFIRDTEVQAREDGFALGKKLVDARMLGKL
jgi:hypothetical protein